MISKFSMAWLGSLALGMLLIPTMAQVPSYAPPPFQPSTFMASVSNLAVPQTGAGDILCITGSASRLVKIKRISLTGTNSTAQTSTLTLIKRSAANTGGTSTAPAGVPLDTLQVATTPTATLAAYTAVPTPGTAVGTISARSAGFAAATASSVGAITWTWDVTSLYSDLRLRGVAQSLCVDAPAAFTTAGPVLNFEIIWTEQ